MYKTGLNICFVGGGSGGHVQPIVSLIEHGQKDRDIAQKCNKIYRFGEKNGQEYRACRQLPDAQFVAIWAGKLRREKSISSFFRNIGDLIKVTVGVVQSIWYLNKYKITTVFCKGGYVAVPVVVAARLMKIKIVVHESDTYMGLANRLATRWATKKFCGFADIIPGADVVGQILSDNLKNYARSTLVNTSSIDRNKTQILVMGGSQGSATIFDVLDKVLTTQDFDNVSFHVVLGVKNERYREVFGDYPYVYCYDFLDQIDLASRYAFCDLAITRGSATSLAEQQLFGLKKIIIPHPWTGGDHQTKNAHWYVNQYSDLYVKQDEQLEDELSMLLSKFSSYKKAWSGLDEQLLMGAKVAIWKALLD